MASYQLLLDDNAETASTSSVFSGSRTQDFSEIASSISSLHEADTKNVPSAMRSTRRKDTNLAIRPFNQESIKGRRVSRPQSLLGNLEHNPAEVGDSTCDTLENMSFEAVTSSTSSMWIKALIHQSSNLRPWSISAAVCASRVLILKDFKISKPKCLRSPLRKYTSHQPAGVMERLV